MLDRNGLAKAAATALTGGYPSKAKGIDRAAVDAVLAEIERQGYVVTSRMARGQRERDILSRLADDLDRASDDARQLRDSMIAAHEANQ